MSIQIKAKGLDELIKKVDTMKKQLPNKMELFIQKLLEHGIPVVDRNYNNPAIGDSSSAHTSYVTVENLGDRIKGTLTVEGEDIAFVEFGAGIYFNHGTEHPQASEFGFGIGTYGQGKGMNDYWYYYDSTGYAKRSYGTEMTMPVYRAGQRMIKDFDSIVKEVFGN